MEKAKPFKVQTPGGLRDHTGKYSEQGAPAPRLAQVIKDAKDGTPPPESDARTSVGGPTKPYGAPKADRKPYRVG